MAAIERRETAGLVVVGGGVGGLVTAIAAADHGHRVVVLERGKDLGGGASVVAECIAAAGTRFQRVADVADDPERLMADLVAASRHQADEAMARALATQSAALVEWLADRCGVAVTLQSTVAGGGHTTPRLHAVGDQGGATLAAVLTRVASHHTHIRIRTATEVEHLLGDDAGGVSGVAVRGDRRGANLVAGPVVLACGGFAADDALVGEHCGEIAGLPYTGAAGAQGDALRLARPLGVATRNLRACAVTPLLVQPSNLIVPRAVIEQGGILVNQGGHRFIDESADALPLALAVRGQPGRVAYVLFDERIAAAVAAVDPFFARVVLPRAGRRAGNVAMLAKQLSLGEQGLALTLETYNANLELGGDPFGRERSGERLEPPLYGVRITAARVATRGGLVTDDAGRVLGEAGGPIPGLQAVGSAVASPIPTIDDGLLGFDALHALGLARMAALALAPVE